MTNILTLAGKIGLTALLLLIFWWLGWFISSLTGLSWAEAAVLSIVGWWIWREGHSE